MEALLGFYTRNLKWFFHVPLTLGGILAIGVAVIGWLAPEFSAANDVPERAAPFVLPFFALFVVNMQLVAISLVVHLTKRRQFATVYNLMFAALIFVCAQGLVLFFLADHFSWFGNKVAEQSQRAPTLLLVLVDTASKGVFLDFMESYGLSFSRFRPVEATLAFDTVIFLFRTLWSIWTAAAAFVVFKGLREQRSRQRIGSGAEHR